jgi:hypothetical protein
MAAKTYDYIITIKPSKNYEAFDWITQLLLFIAAVIIGYSMVKMSFPENQRFAGIASMAAILGGWLYARFTQSSYRIALSGSGLGMWIIVGNLWLGFAYIILAIVERQVKFKQEIGVDQVGVTFNNFPVKSYQWHEVSNVILKDGIITVDLHNNKIFQKELESETTPAMEKEFNHFCRSHLLPIAVGA